MKITQRTLYQKGIDNLCAGIEADEDLQAIRFFLESILENQLELNRTQLERIDSD